MTDQINFMRFQETFLLLVFLVNGIAFARTAQKQQDRQGKIDRTTGLGVAICYGLTLLWILRAVKAWFFPGI